jgi:putative ABC transport system substrate-binding protein
MVAVGDPVGSGFVSNFARPEGNVTGVSNLCGELGAKRLALLKETVPRAVRIAILLNPNDPITAPQSRDIERAAPSLGVQVRFFPARTAQELGPVFEQMMAWRPDSALWLCGQQGALERRMAPLASENRLPMMTYLFESVQAGGLMSYSTDTAELFRRAAVYVDKVLKGAKVAEIPVEQPTKFQLVLNLKTAKTIGLTIPQSVLLRADRVIE